MNFKRSTPRRSFIRPVLSALHEAYPRNVHIYRDPPTCEVTYDEFQECASERLRVLQTIDDINSRGLKGEEWRKTIIDDLRKQDMRGMCKLITNTTSGSLEADCIMRRRDHVSHFILRLAYCDSEDKRRWFVGRELDFFKFRWLYLNAAERSEFLRANNFNFETISESDKVTLGSQSQGLVSPALEYYKVPFTLVSELVRQRKVYLRLGFAYITSEDLISVVLSFYRAELAQALAYASRRMHSLDEDDRIFAVLKGASKNQREIEYSLGEKDSININNLDAMSEMSFPLCMQQLHTKLRAEHHLRHNSRQQYGLFLKGIGVTLEDALRFWRQEFTKKMDLEKFEKSYSYNIRHNYGKEGKRANYAPHSCMKIINSSVGPGDQHGCPFRHSDPVTMRGLLQKNGISVIGIQEITDLIKKSHYQIACSRYFQLKHGIAEQVIIHHPNLYFDTSMKVLSGKLIKKEEPQEPAKARNAPTNDWGDDSGFDFSTVDGI